MSSTEPKAIETLSMEDLQQDGANHTRPQLKPAALAPPSGAGTVAGASAEPSCTGVAEGTLWEQEAWPQTHAKEYMLSPPTFTAPPLGGPPFGRQAASSRQVSLPSAAMYSPHDIVGSLSNRTDWEAIGSTSTCTSPLPSLSDTTGHTGNTNTGPLSSILSAGGHSPPPPAVPQPTAAVATAASAASAGAAAAVGVVGPAVRAINSAAIQDVPPPAAAAVAGAGASAAPVAGVKEEEEVASLAGLVDRHLTLGGRTDVDANLNPDPTGLRQRDGVVATISDPQQGLLATQPIAVEKQWDDESSWESVAWESDPLISAPEVGLEEAAQQQYTQYLSSAPRAAVPAAQAEAVPGSATELGQAAPGGTGVTHPPAATTHHSAAPGSYVWTSGRNHGGRGSGASTHPRSNRLPNGHIHGPAGAARTAASLAAAVGGTDVQAVRDGPPARHRSLPEDLAAILAELPDVDEYCALAELEEHLLQRNTNTNRPRPQ